MSSRRKRQAQTKPTPAKSAAEAPQKQESLSQNKAQAQPSTLRTHLFRLDGILKKTWFYVSIIAFLYGAVTSLYGFRPQLDVVVSSQSDNPTRSLFTITNTGTWSAYDVDISCKFPNDILLENGVRSRHPGAPLEGNAHIDVLRRGQSATRDCSTVNPHVRPDDVRIDLIIDYYWFFGILPSNLTRHFDTRRDGNRFILVPDVESSFPAS